MYRKRGARGGSRGRGIGQRYGTGSQHQGPRGLFENNAWQCDCDPRLPAEHFRVKKEGPNKGRWFYTCQKQQDERCGFFLWDEDAEPRMQSALLANSNRETNPAAGTTHAHPMISLPQTSPTKPSARNSPPPPYTAISDLPHHTSPVAHASSRLKRTRNTFENEESETESESEAYPWPPTAEDMAVAQEAAQAMPSQSRMSTAISPPSTPRKVQKRSEFQTPGTGLRAGVTVENGLITPNTVSHPGRNGIKTETALGQDTPTPVRFHHVVPKAAEDITTTVFSYLEATQTHLSPETATGLRIVLETHAQQVRGLIKGRDIAREAIKTRDMKVAEHIRRVEALEADLDLYRARVKTLRDCGE